MGIDQGNVFANNFFKSNEGRLLFGGFHEATGAVGMYYSLVVEVPNPLTPSRFSPSRPLPLDAKKVTRWKRNIFTLLSRLRIPAEALVCSNINPWESEGKTYFHVLLHKRIVDRILC